MKVRVCYTEDVPDEFRRALRLYRGETGLATRQELKDWFWRYGNTMNDDLMQLVDDAGDEQ
jgi:hypothetical protein